MLFSLLELAGNKALSHDAASVARLEKLQGKTMALHIKKLELTVTVTPQKEGLEFSSHRPEKVDVTLSTTIGALIKISRDGLDNAELDAGELEMSGDPIVGQRFAQIMADLNIDWESLLAEHIGENPARAVTLAAIQTKDFANESRAKLHGFVSNLITEDMKVVASKTEVDLFLNAVDNIRADTDRLEAKLERLRKKVNGSH